MAEIRNFANWLGNTFFEYPVLKKNTSIITAIVTAVILSVCGISPAHGIASPYGTPDTGDSIADTIAPAVKPDTSGKTQAKSVTAVNKNDSSSIGSDTTAASKGSSTAPTDTAAALIDTSAVRRDTIITFGDTAVADTAATDSSKSKKNALDAPVKYTATDSITYDASLKKAFLYGEGDVKYEDMELKAERIEMNLDSSVVHAYGVQDSTGEWEGLPIYTQGSEKYDSDIMSFNFKTKKGFINNVRTEQGEGFLRSENSKRAKDGTLFLEHARYTTCDAKHPDFYIALSRAKVHPGKDVVFGPAYLVVADVPLPLAIPYGFFPFKKKYSSGFLMPTYGDETRRGFYLRDGGYYFAFNDRIDMRLTGEIYTKGSWGINLESNYLTRYKYSGNFFLSYINTVEGEKNMPDYEKTTSFKIQWQHRQDSKALPNTNFSASVNFATESYERKNLSSLYNPQALTQSTRTSSVSFSHTFESIGLTLSATTNLNQNMRDSTIDLTLPDLNISLSRFYPFKRKKLRGKQKWYEKISMSYTGQLSNRISTKENKLLHSNLIKDWRNGMNHQIPVSASFQIFKYINVSPSFQFNDRMYTNKIMRKWDTVNQREVNDTIYGFYNVYDWRMSVSANTTLYGFYKPWRKLFGDGIIAIRHMMKPNISFTYAPDFGADSYGYYDSYVKTDRDGNVSTVTYSPFSNGMFSYPSRGKTGSISMSLSNNLEMKVKSSKDSTGEKKISLIDELSARISYNMAAKTKRWSNLNTNLRLKLWKNYTFSMSAVFATYAYKYDDNGNVIEGDRTEWSYGRFGRFQGMSQNISYTFNNQTFKKLFGKKKEEESTDIDDINSAIEAPEEDYVDEETTDSNVDPTLTQSQNSAKKEKGKSRIDDDGYKRFEIPWSLSVSYGISMREDRSRKINPKTMRYPFSYTQSLNFSGNIRISDGWNINFSSGYDFNYHRLSMTTASLSRDLHCFMMTCSMVLRPFTSYNFSFRAKTSTLADALKWDKRSSYSTNIDWY